jgi:uncharacterized protein
LAGAAGFGLRALFSIAVLLLIAGILLVDSQDFQIFAELQDSVLPGYDPGHDPLPQGVERITLTTPDREELEAWRYPARTEALDGAVGLIFHGNGGTLRTFFEYQQWLAENGITSYGVDYRGYGRSTGWPSESGVYTDVTTLWEYAFKRENVPASRFVLVGISLGSAPASYLAASYSVGAFTSIPDVVGEHPVYFPLWPFIWHEFPTRQHVEESKANCAVFAHGEADTIIIGVTRLI